MSAFRKTVSSYFKHIAPRRHLSFTREGWFVCALALSIGLVAVNTGHNLFYLVFALLLSAVVVSGILSERVLRAIEVKRHASSDVTARVPFAVVVEVKNVSRRKISYSLTIKDSGDFQAPRALGYLAVLQPGELKTFHYLARVEKRGLHRFGRIHITTRFPFGLFEKTRLIPLEESFIAHPGLTETSKLSALALGRERTHFKKWRWGEEILALRPVLPEDDHRFIHWRTSARMGQLMLKEFFEPKDYPRPIFFDNRGVEGDTFEQAVELAANLLRLFIGQGVAATFATWDAQFQPMVKVEDLRPALDHLALITPLKQLTSGGFENWRSQAIREGGGIFIQGGAPPPPSLPACEILRI